MDHFRDITAENSVIQKSNRGNGILIAADGKISGVRIDNVRVQRVNAAKWENGLYDLRPGGGLVGWGAPVFALNAEDTDTSTLVVK